MKEQPLIDGRGMPQMMMMMDSLVAAGGRASFVYQRAVVLLMDWEIDTLKVDLSLSQCCSAVQLVAAAGIGRSKPS